MMAGFEMSFLGHWGRLPAPLRDIYIWIKLQKKKFFGGMSKVIELACCGMLMMNVREKEAHMLIQLWHSADHVT
jgi:hypothetical protein